MNRDETRNLLRMVSAYDRWIAKTPQEEAGPMLEAWTHTLEAVPAEFAVKVVGLHYRQAQASSITPGDIAETWRSERIYLANQRRQAEARAVGEAAAALTAGDTITVADEVVPVGGATAYLAALADAARAGRPTSSVPRPAGVRVLPAAADRLARRCVYHDACACDHTECRDGWLDEEVPMLSALARTYHGVRRCPHCLDALKMAEDSGRAKKPSGAARRR